MRDAPKTMQIGEVQLNIAELACRLGEAFTDVPRPSGLSPGAVLATLPEATQTTLLEAARVAIAYVVEMMHAGLAGHVTIVTSERQGEPPN